MLSFYIFLLIYRLAHPHGVVVAADFTEMHILKL